MSLSILLSTSSQLSTSLSVSPWESIAQLQPLPRELQSRAGAAAQATEEELGALASSIVSFYFKNAHRYLCGFNSSILKTLKPIASLAKTLDISDAKLMQMHIAWLSAYLSNLKCIYCERTTLSGQPLTQETIVTTFKGIDNYWLYNETGWHTCTHDATKLPLMLLELMRLDVITNEEIERFASQISSYLLQRGELYLYLWPIEEYVQKLDVSGFTLTPKQFLRIAEYFTNLTELNLINTKIRKHSGAYQCVISVTPSNMASFFGERGDFRLLFVDQQACFAPAALINDLPAEIQDVITNRDVINRAAIDELQKLATEIANFYFKNAKYQFTYVSPQVKQVFRSIGHLVTTLTVGGSLKKSRLKSIARYFPHLQELDASRCDYDLLLAGDRLSLIPHHTVRLIGPKKIAAIMDPVEEVTRGVNQLSLHSKTVTTIVDLSKTCLALIAAYLQPVTHLIWESGILDENKKVERFFHYPGLERYHLLFIQAVINIRPKVVMERRGDLDVELREAVFTPVFGTTIKSLDIRRATVNDEDDSWLKSLVECYSGLQSLHLPICTITAARAMILGQWRELTEIDMSLCRKKNIGFLRYLSKLTTIKNRFPHEDGNIWLTGEEAKRKTALYHRSIPDPKVVRMLQQFPFTPQDIALIVSLKAPITHLILGGGEYLGDRDVSSFANLRLLEALDLSNSPHITVEGIRGLKGLKLRYLSVLHCPKLGNETMQCIAKQHPRLREFKFGGDLYTDAAMEALAKLTDLHTLVIGEVKNVSLKGWKMLEKLPKLEQLLIALSDLLIKDKLIFLRQLPALKILRVKYPPGSRDKLTEMIRNVRHWLPRCHVEFFETSFERRITFELCSSASSSNASSSNASSSATSGMDPSEGTTNTLRSAIAAAAEWGKIEKEKRAAFYAVETEDLKQRGMLYQFGAEGVDKDEPKALQYLTRAHQQDPENIPILFQLGTLYKDGGAGVRNGFYAMKYFSAILKLEPDNAIAQDALASVMQNNGTFAVTASLSDAALESMQMRIRHHSEKK